MVCNTPKSSLEIWEISNSTAPTLTLRSSIPTGQEPISVAIKPTPESGNKYIAYTCNWIGDSISRIVITTAITGGVGSIVDARLDRTEYVGDEPMNIAFMPNLGSTIDPGGQTAPGGSFFEELLVCFGTYGGWGMFNPTTLAVPAAGFGAIDLRDLQNNRSLHTARTIAVSPPTSTQNPPNGLFVLNQRGGQSLTPANVRSPSDPTSYDFDLWQTQDPFFSQAFGGLGYMRTGLGSTNLNMTFASNGDLFVVGTEARNLEVGANVGGPPSAEALHQAFVNAGSGLARSTVWRVRGLTTSAPGTVEKIDLNAGTSVFNDKIAQPTDVVSYERGSTSKIIVAGFNSDTIAIITPATTFGGSTIQRVVVGVGGPSTMFGSGSAVSGVMRGPRGMAVRLDPVNSSGSNDHVVIYNSMEHSITTVPLTGTATVTSTALLTDPRPGYIKNARKFLYSSRLSSTNTTSCATCHVDAHTDQLDWNLSSGSAIVPINTAYAQTTTNLPITVTNANPHPRPGALMSTNMLIPTILAPALQQALIGASTPLPTPSPYALAQPRDNPAEKGPMVTQSLRGLVNFEVSNQLFSDLFFSNRPYHWRGDRPNFDDFNTAFVNLMGITSPTAVGVVNPFSTPPTPHGELDLGIPSGPAATLPLSHSDTMDGFRQFINSIHYPPNPEQPKNRRYSGSMLSSPSSVGTPQEILDINNTAVGVGSLAQRGMKVFHQKSYNGTRFISCVSCHILPDCSDNVMTDLEFGFNPDPSLAAQSLETAQLRSIVHKEKRLFRRNTTTGALIPSGFNSTTISGNVGMIHTGAATTNSVPNADSIRGFISNFLTFNSLNNPSQVFSGDIDDLTLFVRELDTGVGPAIGLVGTVDSSVPIGLVTATLTVWESFAREGNCGIVAKLVTNGAAGTPVHYGFYFDVAASSATVSTYREVAPVSYPSFLGAATTIPLNSTTPIGLLQQVYTNGHKLIFECVPLGNERRLSFVDSGNVPTVTVATPTITSGTVDLVCMTANQNVPKMTSGAAATFDSVSANETSPVALTAVCEQILIVDAALAVPPGFGLGTQLRHEAPRRVRVQGTNVQPGAVVRLFFPNAADLPTIGTATPSVPTTATNLSLDLPIFPVIDASGVVSYETAVELSPESYLPVMCGLSTDALMQAVMFNTREWAFVLKISFGSPNLSTAYPAAGGIFSPLTRNWVYAQIVNAPNGAAPAASNGGWMRMVIK